MIDEGENMVNSRFQNFLCRFLLAVVMGAPALASAQYYTTASVGACQGIPQYAATGAIAGGATGFFAGMALSGGRLRAGLVGGAIGAVAGGVLGTGLGCSQEAAYMAQVDLFLARPMRGVMCQNGVCVYIQRSGYISGRRCMTYHYEIPNIASPYGRDETACLVNGVWTRGPYPAIPNAWVAPMMTTAQMGFFPVLAFGYRMYPGWGHYWGGAGWGPRAYYSGGWAGGGYTPRPYVGGGAPAVRPYVGSGVGSGSSVLPYQYHSQNHAQLRSVRRIGGGDEDEELVPDAAE